MTGFWTQWEVGTRVVVRRRLPDGMLGDVLGAVLETGPDGVLVRTRTGDVRVGAEAIVVGKTVPPPPVRRAPRAPGASADPRSER